jgi:Putative transposase/Transposase zinc-binding domain
MSLQQRRILRALTSCRTAALGGHKKQCESCGHEAIAYNSCRNRHCPKCQAAARAQWLDARAADLLEVPYFHVVFTLPEPLGPLALQNKRLLYGMLFRAASETLCTIARDRKHLGANIGFLAVLHTWGQNLHHHPHLHCVVPGGGLALDGSHWVACREQFFLPVRVLSRLFRGKFLAYLRAAFDQGTLAFHGKLETLADRRNWSHLLRDLDARDWVVYAKRPFGGPTQVLKYLARYTHRVAISNRRLVSLADARVTFRWKDYAKGNHCRTMTLDAVEFIRRFLLHALPTGFQRIRQYGFLANRVRHEKLPLCRALLRRDKEDATLGDRVTVDEAGTTGVAPSEAAAADESCPACRKGRMIVVAKIEPGGRPDHPAPQPFDTS